MFVLRGRRLSYYYSETDTEEKGLIDISFHRVLPATNDRITGLHATFTGAANSPTSPQNAQIETTAASDAAKAAENGDTKANTPSTLRNLPCTTLPSTAFNRDDCGWPH